MTDLYTAIAMILASAAGGLGWDAYLAIRGRLRDGGDYCDGLRAVNRYTGGLFCLTLLALWIHVFCSQWFPLAWGAPK